MRSVRESLALLDAAVLDGRLAAVAERRNLELVALFGSAVDLAAGADPDDIDIAVGHRPSAARDFLGVFNDLADLGAGDHLDLLDLDRADPVAQRAVTDHMLVLYEAEPGVAAEREIKAFMEFEDTRWLRRLQREALIEGGPA